jgi:hypothetical protein
LTTLYELPPAVPWPVSTAPSALSVQVGVDPAGVGLTTATGTGEAGAEDGAGELVGVPEAVAVTLAAAGVTAADAAAPGPPDEQAVSAPDRAATAPRRTTRRGMQEPPGPDLVQRRTTRRLRPTDRARDTLRADARAPGGPMSDVPFWGPDFAALQAEDPEIAAVVLGELDRLRGGLQLIASENFTSPAVLAAVGSTLSNKYAEGYPGKRYYGGCAEVDKAENIGIDRAKALFGADHANLQPHSGASANIAAYAAFTKPGDTVLAMSLPHGGHLTHGSKVNTAGTSPTARR